MYEHICQTWRIALKPSVTIQQLLVSLLNFKLSLKNVKFLTSHMVKILSQFLRPGYLSSLMFFFLSLTHNVANLFVTFRQKLS